MHETTARLRVAITSDNRVRVWFTRGEAEVELRFPYAPEDDELRDNAGHDLTVLIDNRIIEIDHANLEIEAALLRQEVMTDE